MTCRWCTAALQHWSTGALQHCSTGALQHCSTAALEHWSTGALEHRPTPMAFLNAAPVPVLNPLTEIRYFQLLQQVLQQQVSLYHSITPTQQHPQKTETPT
tara:strand:- start:632 stop:934 length:303 start_codon:yes stop_codon:yes gene_type:complete